MSGYYRIRHHVEEGPCTLCGWPSDIGDRAYEGTDGYCYCSRHCAEQAGAATTQHPKPSPVPPQIIRAACTMGKILDRRSADR